MLSSMPSRPGNSAILTTGAWPPATPRRFPTRDLTPSPCACADAVRGERARRAPSSFQRGVEGDLCLKKPGHRAVGLGPGRYFGKLLLRDSGHLAGSREVNGRDGPARLRVVFKSEGGGRVEGIGGKAGPVQGRREGHCEAARVGR